MTIDFNKKIFVAGHLGMVGSAILNQLNKEGYNNLVFKPRSKLNLVNQDQVLKFLDSEKHEAFYSNRKVLNSSRWCHLIIPFSDFIKNNESFNFRKIRNKI